MRDTYNLFVPFYLSHILMTQLRTHNLPIALLAPSPRKNIDESLKYCMSRFAIEGYKPKILQEDRPIASLVDKRIAHLMYATGDVDDKTFSYPIPVIMFAASYCDVIVVACADRHLYLGYIDYTDVEQHFIDMHGSIDNYLHAVQESDVRKELAVVVVDFDKFAISKSVRTKLLYMFDKIDWSQPGLYGAHTSNNPTIHNILAKR